jgi:peptide deformylase
MAIRRVLMIGNPILRKRSSEVKKRAEAEKILGDLRDTLIHLQKKKRIGRALAAPQIGYLRKIVYFNLPKRSFAMVNPKIVWKSKGKFEVWDSCFSFDVSFFVKIKRHKRIRVEYRTVEGNPLTEEFKDDTSELVQHEIDHLHGILATDHLHHPKNIMMRGEWEKRYR